ncbi:MAG TPA: TauD/TfdA family dioxygenase [Burkholderiales bacterium]|nr:TauD/TfdA family dioxygenase [Burkholderiales bacterium]
MPPGLLAGPAVWYGPEMAARADWVMRFSPEDIAELDAAVARFARSGAALADISPASFELESLAPRLSALLRELLEGRGFVLMRGLPVDRYTREQTAIAYMGIGSYLGRPRSQNAKGHLLGHVKDLGVDVTDPNVRYYQTKRRLEYHTDSVDIVGLLCLKTAKSGGESYIASSATCYNEIASRRPDLLPLLFEPFPTDRRGEVPAGMLPWFDMPVFHWHADKLTAIYVRQYIESAQANFPDAKRLTPAHREALDLLDALTNDPAIHLSMRFEPGDMQFLHNHQVLHSRTDFENWPEPERHRHLLRLWLCPKEGRPLPEVFAPRYGSTTPGERGGIVVQGTRLNVPLEAV